MRPLKPYQSLKYAHTFKKDFKKLSRKTQASVTEALKEIEALKEAGGELSPQRQCKIRKGERNPERWQIRLAGQYRLTFHYETIGSKTILVYRRAAPHRQIEKSS